MADKTAPFYTNVSSKYGAPMGRRSDAAMYGKLRLVRVPFVDSCYDPGGAYWGMPANLYCAWNDEGTHYLRASSREDAKAQLVNKFVDVSFYR